MNKFYIALIISVVVLTGNVNCYADQDEDTLELLKITGSLDMGAQMGAMIVQQMATGFKELRPDIDPRIFAIIEEEVISSVNYEMNNSNGLVQELIQIYSKYYSHQDIKDLLKFYRSDLGKKLILNMPNVMQESVAAGQNRTQIIFPKVRERVKKRLEQEGINIQ